MSLLFVSSSLFMWHIVWNMALNKTLGSKWVSLEQVCVSMFVGILFQMIGQWSVTILVTLIFILSIMYYINLIHVRFFGHIVPTFQIRQFLFSKQTAKTNSSMLFQATARLIKPSDLFYFIIFVGVVILSTINYGYSIDPLWQWGTINIILIVLIALTFTQYKKMKTGTIDINKFGMFLSYYFIALQEKAKQAERTQLIQAIEDELHEEESESIQPEDEFFGQWKGMNVILIQLESFQQFLLHHKVEGQEVTPFLNKLARENIEFNDVFSQYAMGHTCDAELASLQSLFPLKNEITNYKHYDKNFFGLPHILTNNGYQSIAYHGFKGDFYNRRSMMITHGFESFISEEDYLATERASTWLSDFSFFEQSVQKIKKMKKPFFSFMISLTSHFPFELEKKHWGLKLSQEIPHFLASYYQSINYTDRALEHFYNKLIEEGLHENTVFAFYGDHEGVTPENLSSLYDHLGVEQSDFLKVPNRLSLAKVPFVLASGDSKRRISISSNKTGSTLDVGQTLLHLLGLPRIPSGMGNSLLIADEDRVIPLSQYPLGSFVTKDTLCYADDSGDYSKSILFDRISKRIILPISGPNQTRFNYSKQLMIKSDYMIVNNLLLTKDLKVKSEMKRVTFSPKIERLLTIVDDDAVIIPIRREIEEVYLKEGLESIRQLENYYRLGRNKNIRFYSTLDISSNNKPIYFEDLIYQNMLNEQGYLVDLAIPVPFQKFLTSLPDNVIIIVSARDEASSQFYGEFAQDMRNYGFHLLNQKLSYRHSYINLIYKNKGFISLYEEVSENPLERKWECFEFIKGIALPFDLKVTSKGALVGNKSEIIVNGLSCSQNLRGLNLAVVDMGNNSVIEMIRVDTCTTTNIDNGIYRADKSEHVQEDVM